MEDSVNGRAQYTRWDLQSAMAEELRVAVSDPRIDAVYMDMIHEWIAEGAIPEESYGSFFSDEPVAGKPELEAARSWAHGRILL